MTVAKDGKIYLNMLNLQVPAVPPCGPSTPTTNCRN